MQSALCTYLSAVLLAGLLLNLWLGRSWAAPIAALVIAGVAIKEGVQAWRGEQCDDCAVPWRRSTIRGRARERLS